MNVLQYYSILIILNITMATLQNYNLTHYTNFRQLEFDYARVRDQNEDLKLKLIAVQNMYHETIAQLQQIKNNEAKKQETYKNQNANLHQKVKELFSCMESNINSLKCLKTINFDVSMDIKAQKNKCSLQSQVNNLKNEMLYMTDYLLMLDNKNSDLTLKYERQKQRVRQCNNKNGKYEQQLKEEISYLNEQIFKLQNEHKMLQADLNITKRDNADLRFRAMQDDRQIQQAQQDHAHQIIQDSSFALDLLHYQKQLLQRIFAKVLSSFKNELISQILVDIYAGYEAVSAAFREKLQIQYDLEDLERQYKRERNTKISQHLLIQLRKQIQQFRNQLAKQKQTQSKAESELQSNLLNLQVAQKEQTKIRSYAFQIQKKLKDMKGVSQSKPLPQQSLHNSMTRVKFRPSNNNQEIMREMVKKDRQNIEKIFRETRLGYLKGHTSD